ncbi:hypothetical protein JCM8547_005237 [Rhodosporidiobolus lusitaniae]
MLITVFAVFHPRWMHQGDAVRSSLILGLMSVLVYVVVACHETPCPRYERFRMAEHVLYRNRKIQERIMDFLEVNFARPVPRIGDALGNPNNMQARLATSEATWSAKLAQLVSRLVQFKAGEGVDKTGESHQSIPATLGLLNDEVLDKLA